MDNPVLRRLEVLVSPLCNCRLLREQNDLATFVGERLAHLQDGDGPGRVCLDGDVIEEQRAHRRAGGQVLGECYPQQQVDLLGGTDAQQVGIAKLAGRGLAVRPAGSLDMGGLSIANSSISASTASSITLVDSRE